MSPGLSAGLVVDRSLQQVCEELRARRLRAEISVQSPWGEPDVRLEVRPDTEDGVTVEVLAPDPVHSPVPPAATWHAVRIQDGRRAVWRGPALGCCPDDLGRFVQALLALGSAQLSQMYTYLG